MAKRITIDQLNLSGNALTQVQERQYAIVDDFLPQEIANQLLEDANSLHREGGHFQQHYFQFGGALLKKPNVFELDLSDPTKHDRYNNLGIWKEMVGEVGPSFLRRIDELEQQQKQQQTAANESIEKPSSLLALETNTPPAIKLQINTGGGSFPWHFDNPGPPNARMLTCVVYLNPNWSEGDGGEIVLCPFLSKYVVVPPLHGRAVLFRSDRILHRVLPSRVRRVCFTMWCNGTRANDKRDVALSRDVLQFASYDDAQTFFSKSPLQRVISRAVYSEEYLESLLECIVSKNGSDEEGIMKDEERGLIIKQHEASVHGIRQKLRPLIDEFRRRKCEHLLSTGR